MKSIVGVEIECFGRYCLNDCPWMRNRDDRGFCCLFRDDNMEPREVKWDKRRKFNGYLRLTECKQAEGK